jgi:hypothetical protein
MLRPPRRLLWTLVSLTRARLGRRWLARLGLALAVLIAVAVGVSALVVHLVDGAEANLGGAIAQASTWVAWLGAGPVALAAADRQAARDRAEGLDDLVATRGAPSAWLVAGRTLAAMAQVALVIAAPLTALALIVAGLAPSTAAAWRALTQGLGALGFAVTVGVAIGGLAALAGRAHRGGPLVLITIVLGPWLVASAFDRSAWSIPGALEAALTLFLAPVGGGA